MTLHNPECFTVTLKYPEQWEEIKEARRGNIGVGIEFDSFADFLRYAEDLNDFDCELRGI